MDDAMATTEPPADDNVRKGGVMAGTDRKRALPDVDYHREKYGLVALADYLSSVEGWDKVLLTVVPGSLDDPAGPRGLVPPVIDAARDRADPHYGEIF